MRLVELVTGAADALRVNKLRSSLTTLGIIIGVGAVVAMMALTSGLGDSINKEFSGLGANTFQIQKEGLHFGGGRHMAKYRNRRDITLANFEAVDRQNELARFVGAELWNFAGALRSRYGQTQPNVSVTGGTVAFTVNNGYDIKDGRDLNESDITHERSVVVLGSDVARTLFPNASSIGQPIILGGRRYLVIGEFEERGSMFGAENRDNFALIPISTFIQVYGKNRSVNITVQTMQPEQFDDTKERAIQIMRRERLLKPDQENDFEIFSNESVIDTISSLTDSIRFAAIGICFIALLVGGIGITNIMIVSVTERTREIGVRMALGAKRRNVLWQFTIEAILLSAVGGILGLGFGLGVAKIVAAVSPVPATVPIWAVVVALTMSSATGLIFGIYPAWRASRLDPIEALRYE